MGEMLSVLIVEDSEDDTLLLVRELTNAGYDPEYVRVETPEVMVDAIFRQNWDLVLSDHRMPNFNALEALRISQDSGLDVPFIIVSGKIGEEAAVEIMKAGAHDYVSKNDLGRLVPAIGRELKEAEMRRAHRRTEEYLKQAQNFTKIVLNGISDALLVIDTDNFKIIDANGVFLDLVGLGKSEIIGKTCYEVTHHRTDPCTLPDDRCPMLDTLKTGKTQSVEHIHYNAKGETFYVEITTSAIRNEKGEIYQVVHASRDITDRKLAEIALVESEKKYRTIIENSNDMIWTLDCQGNITFFNNKSEELTGYKLDDWVGKSFVPLLPEEYLEDIQNIFMNVLAGHPQQYEVPVIKSDGSDLLLSVSTVPIYESGAIVGTVSFGKDITGHKLAEKKYRTLFESSSDAIMLLDETGFFDCNPAALRIFGYDKVEDFTNIHPAATSPPFQPDGMDSVTAANSRMKDAFEKGHANFEWVHKRKNGDEFPADVTLSAFPYGGKKVLQTTVRDITQRKQAEEQLNSALTEKETLLKEIHHRVKNNMQVISSLLRLQSDYVKDKEYLKMFEESQNRIVSMALVHEKLYRSGDLSNIDFDEYLRELSYNLIDGFQASNVTLDINARGMSLDIDLAIPCGLIINELVTNSLKYAFPDGRKGIIRIGLSSGDDNMVTLVVSDDGVGIPDDVKFGEGESLGSRLVKLLGVNQLHGNMTIDKSNGTEIRIEFKAKK